MLTRIKSPLFDTLESILEQTNFNERSYKSSITNITEDNYQVLVSVPGLSKDDIKITSKDGLLTVSYDKSKESKNSFVGSFKKIFSLPEDGDEGNITGKVENGVVEILIPKVQKKPTERIIVVR